MARARASEGGFPPPPLASPVSSSARFYPRINAACVMHPPTDRPGLPRRKNTILPRPPSLSLSFFLPSTLPSAATLAAFQAIHPRLGGTSLLLNPRAAYYAAVVRAGGWISTGMVSGGGRGPGTRRQIEGFSRVSAVCRVAPRRETRGRFLLSFFGFSSGRSVDAARERERERVVPHVVNVIVDDKRFD